MGDSRELCRTRDLLAQTTRYEKGNGDGVICEVCGWNTTSSTYRQCMASLDLYDCDRIGSTYDRCFISCNTAGTDNWEFGCTTSVQCTRKARSCKSESCQFECCQGDMCTRNMTDPCRGSKQHAPAVITISTCVVLGSILSFYGRVL
ncbi:uncharacterized protein LOC116605428 isoform X2 [Nematostella vectensis]|uniref:uncharacterized protein LOC116605428 isoform X2 n=1 Tax=Nematostella vectensis TaxID=45351 RepID=UPI00207731AF|nr:uncharacterized protein LOC116605428 isoform X2 [Nematostella vectensis]